MDPAVDERLRGVLERSRELGFLGPTAIERQIAHAGAFARAVTSAKIADPERVMDLGSGGGLPGLVLASVWLHATMTLLDGSVRRCAFLEEACDELGLAGRVSVLCGRAEDLGRSEDLRGSVDLVVARSFGAPAVVAECAAGFLEVGGHLVVSEPPDGSSVDRWPTAGLGLLGLGPAERIDDGAHFVVARQDEPCPDRFPRRVGVPTKRPLFSPGI